MANHLALCPNAPCDNLITFSELGNTVSVVNMLHFITIFVQVLDNGNVFENVWKVVKFEK